MNKIKVVCVVPSLDMGGAEKMALDLVTYLDKSRMEVFLISLYSSKNRFYARLAEQRNINVIYLNKKRGFDPVTYKKLYKTLNDLKPNVIHTHLHSAIYCVPWCIVNKKTRWIHTIHTDALKEMPFYYMKIMRTFYKNKIIVPVAISKKIKETILNTYKLQGINVPVIFNGIDTELFTSTENNKEDSKIRFCCVARFNHAKNHKMLINAFKIALEKNKNISLYLVGDGELRKEIESQIIDCELESDITLLGSCENIRDILHESDVFILSSIYEGLPLSILEAMSSGLPVISTKVGGISDVLDDGKEGFLIGENNTSEMADAILKIATDKKLRDKMSLNSRIKAKEYDIRKMAREYEVLYKSYI